MRFEDSRPSFLFCGLVFQQHGEVDEDFMHEGDEVGIVRRDLDLFISDISYDVGTWQGGGCVVRDRAFVDEALEHVAHDGEMIEFFVFCRLYKNLL